MFTNRNSLKQLISKTKVFEIKAGTDMSKTTTKRLHFQRYSYTTRVCAGLLFTPIGMGAKMSNKNFFGPMVEVLTKIIIITIIIIIIMLNCF